MRNLETIAAIMLQNRMAMNSTVANDNDPWAKIERLKSETEAAQRQDAIKQQLISAWGRVYHG